MILSNNVFLRPAVQLTRSSGSTRVARSFAAPARSEANMQELYMRAVEPKAVAKQRPTPEEVSEGYKLARTATKLMFKRHYVMNRDLTRKAKLKWAAISALPTEEMQRDALLIDPYIPFNVRVARITPPLSGFHTPEEKERERLIADAAAAAGTKQVETVTVQATPTRTIGTKRTTTRRTGANAEVSLGAFLPPRKEPVDVKPSAPPAAPAPFNPFPGKKGKK